MPTNHLVVFGEDWQGLPSSTQHLITHLAQHYSITWINSIGLRQPRLTTHDIHRAFTKLLGTGHAHTVPVSSNAPTNIRVLNLKTWPAPKARLLRKACGWVMALQLKHYFKKYSITQPIIWASLPTAVDAIKCLKASLRIYYCCDDFAGLAGVDHATVSQHENDLIQYCDWVVVSQQPLQQKFAPTKTRLLNHGVDWPLFSTPAPRAHDLPNNGKPIAGFYGSLANWLDEPLLVMLAQQLPGWDFVFIGQGTLDTRHLKTFKNIYFLGPKPHHLLPHYCQHWQASLLPFKDCPQIRHCDPLKLREYLAAGSPVVSTSFPAAHNYQQWLHIGHNETAFLHELKKIGRAWQPNGLSHVHQHTQRLAQQLAVGSESWEARANQLHQWLQAGV